MEKKLLLIPLLFLFIISMVNAQDVQISSTAINSKVSPGGTTEFELKIYNNQPFADSIKIRPNEFDVFPFSDNIKRVLIGENDKTEYTAVVNSRSLRVVPVKIVVSEDARPDVNYGVNFDFISKTGEKYDHDVVVNVISPENLVSVRTDFPDELNPGSDAKFSLSLTGNVNVVIDNAEVIILSELFEERLSTPIFFKRSTKKDINFGIGSDVTPGFYTLSIKAYRDSKLIGSLIKEFEVVKNPDIEEVVEVSKGFLTEEISMRKINTGNLAVRDSFAYSVTSFSKLFVKTIPEPDRIEENRLIWDFELKPNQSYEVDVVVDYTGLFIFIVVILALIALGIYYYTKKVFITKSALKVKDEKGGISELKIKLHIKNRDTNLKNVEILDIVPNIAKPMDEYGTLKPDRVQKSSRGRRLVWHIKSLDKGEERVISYMIKSELSIVDKLFLPSAVVRYRKGKKNYDYKSNRLVFISTSRKLKKSKE